MRKALAIAIALLALGGLSAFAQQQIPLPLTKSDPAIDGVVAKSEYATSVQVGKMLVSVARTADVLYAAITADTTGWVGLGFGSDKMDGALIVMGFVSGKQVQVKLQQGQGRVHVDVASKALLKYAGTEVGGKTTLEFSLSTAELLKSGQKQLGAICSWGATDDFLSYHGERTPLVFVLE